MRIKLSDFGADPNGPADSRPALQDALRALSISTDLKRELDLEGASYVLGSYTHPNKVVDVPFIPNLRIFDGHISVESWTDNSCRTFVFAQGLDNVRFEGVQIDDLRAGPSSEKQSHTIFVYGSTNARGLILEECEIYAAGGDAIYMGASNNGSDGLVIRGLKGEARRNLICVAGDDWVDGVRDGFDIDRVEVLNAGLTLGSLPNAVWFERGSSSKGHPDRYINVRVRRVVGGVIGTANCDALIELCEVPKIVVTSMVGKIRDSLIYGWPSPSGGIGDGNGWCIDGRGGDRLDVDIYNCDFEVPPGGSGVISCRLLKNPMTETGEMGRPSITVSRSCIKLHDPSTQQIWHSKLLKPQLIAIDVI